MDATSKRCDGASQRDSTTRTTERDAEQWKKSGSHYNTAEGTKNQPTNARLNQPKASDRRGVRTVRRCLVSDCIIRSPIEFIIGRKLYKHFCLFCRMKLLYQTREHNLYFKYLLATIIIIIVVPRRIKIHLMIIHSDY